VRRKVAKVAKSEQTEEEESRRRKKKSECFIVYYPSSRLLLKKSQQPTVDRKSNAKLWIKPKRRETVIAIERRRVKKIED
jgi:hypothetical protein